jgi:hypothetical protein
MFGAIPNVSHLRVFGSTCTVLIPKQLWGGKFSPVSVEGTFLGYQGKGYRVLIDDRVRIARVEDVIVIETSPVPANDTSSLEIPLPLDPTPVPVEAVEEAPHAPAAETAEQPPVSSLTLSLSLCLILCLSQC